MKTPGFGSTLGMVLVMAGTAIQSHGFRPVAGYRALEFDATPAHVGILAAAFAFGAFVFAVPAGKLNDRFGPGVVIIAASILAPGSLAIGYTATNLQQLFASALVFGVAQILVVVTLQSAISIGRKRTQLDVVFGWLTAGTSTGQILGPLLALALPSLFPKDATSTGILILFVLSIVTGIGGIFIGLKMKRHGFERTSRHERLTSRQIVRTKGMLAAFMASGIVLACIDLLTVFIPIWAAERGISQMATGFILALRGSVSLLSRIGIGKLTAVISRKHLIVGSMTAGMIALAAIPFSNLWQTAIAVSIIGFGFGLIQPLTLTWVITVVDATSRGSALGLRMFCNRLLQVLIPLGVSALAQPLAGLGTASARSFGVAATTLFASILFSSRYDWKTDDASEDD